MNILHAVLYFFFLLPICNYDTSVEIKKEFHWYDIVEDLAPHILQKWGISIMAWFTYKNILG